ncbi:MAG: hypothetical protein JW940_34350 [Polyangiaceae bacterium]|nr:hypothetical protein [Polyangiaceae bacterium]
MTHRREKALIDECVGALTRTYVDQYDAMDAGTRLAAMKLLASYRDPRTEPALRMALERFARQPLTDVRELDVRWAVRAVAEQPVPSLGEPLLEAFLELRASTQLDGRFCRDFQDATQRVASPSWAGTLRGLLAAPIVLPTSQNDTEGIDAYRHQLFWQTTAAQVLGGLRDSGAVEPLLRVLLDPTKGDVASPALLALVRIGRPAVTPTLELLEGHNAALEQFRRERVRAVIHPDPSPAQASVVPAASLVLGAIGRAEALPAFLRALEAETNESIRAQISSDMAKLPKSAEALAAFERVCERTSLEALIPPGMAAAALLAETAARFYDPSLVPRLLTQIRRVRVGDPGDVEARRHELLGTAIKLAEPNQLDAVRPAVKKHGSLVEKHMFALAEEELRTCGSDVSCHVRQALLPENHDKKGVPRDQGLSHGGHPRLRRDRARTRPPGRCRNQLRRALCHRPSDRRPGAKGLGRDFRNAGCRHRPSRSLAGSLHSRLGQAAHRCALPALGQGR